MPGATPRSRSRSHTLSLSRTLSLTHTHSLSLSHTQHTLSLLTAVDAVVFVFGEEIGKELLEPCPVRPLARALAHTLSLSRTLSLTHTHSLSHTHTQHSLSLLTAVDAVVFVFGEEIAKELLEPCPVREDPPR